MYFSPTRSGPLQQQDSNSLSMYPDENHEPFLDILEHPKARGFRFRYSCEGPSHGGIPGASSDKNKKTYPAVQIKNYTGYARIVVQLVTNEENPRLHPHSLVGKQCQNGICTVQCGPKDMTATFPNLGIQHVTKKNVAKILEERYMAAEMQLSSLNEGLTIDVQNAIKEEDRKRIQAKAMAEAKSIDLSVVRLMFIAYLPDSNGAFTLMLKPVISDAIFDSKSPNAATLKICRMDKTFGAASGMDEIYLLCDKVQKDDIQIKFFEEDANGEETWDAYGDFSPTDVHRQFAIVFRTPRYRNVSIDHPVQVLVQLRRRSDGEVSEARPFTYMPVQDDPEQIGRKRRKVHAHFQDHISGNRANGNNSHGGPMSGNPGFVFQSNGGSNSGMKQSRYGPPPKAKNPQAGPVDPTMLLQKMNWMKQEPHSPPMTNGISRSNPTSPESFVRSPLSAYSACSPQSIHSPYSDNGTTNGNIQSPVQQMIPGTMIPIPRNVTPPRQEQQHVQMIPGTQVPVPRVINSPANQQYVQYTQAQQQQALGISGRIEYVQYPATTTANALYYSPEVAQNYVVENEGVAIENADDMLSQIMSIVSQADGTHTALTTITTAGISQKFQQQDSVLEFLATGDLLYEEIECDSTAEKQIKEKKEETPVNEEEFSRGMQEAEAKLIVKTEQPAAKELAVETDSCTIAPQEVEIRSNQPVKEALRQNEKVTEERAQSPKPAPKEVKNNVESNITDDMKLNTGPALISKLDKDSLRTLLINITKRTAKALQEFAASGDIRFLLATQRQLTDVQDVDGDTSVHLAVINGQDEVLIALIHLIQTIPGGQSIVNRTNDLQLTPLHIAIHIENISAVKWLLNAGADVLARDSKGNTAIHLACSTGQADILEYLLGNSTENIETHNYNGFTPLHILASKVTEGTRQCISMLVRHGHNVDAGDMKSGRTALHIAAEENNLIIAGYLLSECYADIECRTFDGLTPLHIAVARDCQEISTLLLACGADPQAEYAEDFDSTPATLCVSKKMRDILLGEKEFEPCSHLEDADDICSLDPLTRLKLCRLMDPREIGRDWYALADRLGLGTLVDLIDDQEKSPTESLLENYSCIQGSISGLKSALNHINRQDAFNLLVDTKKPEMRASKQDFDVEGLDSAIGSMSLSEQTSIPGC